MVGREALPELSRDLALNDDWKDVDSDEEDRLLTQLREYRAQKEEAKTVKVPSNFAANDIENTMGRVDTEVN